MRPGELQGCFKFEAAGRRRAAEIHRAEHIAGVGQARRRCVAVISLKRQVPSGCPALAVCAVQRCGVRGAEIWMLLIFALRSLFCGPPAIGAPVQMCTSVLAELIV